MRHRVFGYQLNRDESHRRALRRTLIVQLLDNERITTTIAKARAIRGEAERVITVAKRGILANSPLHRMNALRLIVQKTNDKKIAKKVVDDIAIRYANRAGGYTRMIKLGQRKGDAADMAILELVEE